MRLTERSTSRTFPGSHERLLDELFADRPVMCHEIERTHQHVPVVLHYRTECLAVAALAAPDRILLVDHVLSWSPAAFIRNIQAIGTIGSLHCCGERQLTRVVCKKDMMLFASGWAIPLALYYRTSRDLSPGLSRNS